MIVWVTGKKTIRKRAGEYLISDEGKTFRASDGRWPAVVSGHDVHKTFDAARAYLHGNYSKTLRKLSAWKR